MREKLESVGWEWEWKLHSERAQVGKERVRIVNLPLYGWNECFIYYNSRANINKNKNLLHYILARFPVCIFHLCSPVSLAVAAVRCVLFSSSLYLWLDVPSLNAGRTDAHCGWSGKKKKDAMRWGTWRKLNFIFFSFIPLLLNILFCHAACWKA